MVMLVLVLVLVVLLLAGSFFFLPHVQDLQPEAPVHELTCDL